MTGSRPRPCLLIDIDFTLNPDFSAVWGTAEGDRLRSAGWAVVGGGFLFNGRPVWLNLFHGRDLLRVAYETGAELAWATNWHHLANQLAAPALGLPRLAVATSPPLAKTDAAIAWANGRPFVWLDDQDDVAAACDAAPNGSVVKVNPETGLTEADLAEAVRLLTLPRPGSPAPKGRR